jgi:pimeloyl-ACP methyl ester carboxylesterase
LVEEEGITPDDRPSVYWTKVSPMPLVGQHHRAMEKLIAFWCDVAEKPKSAPPSRLKELSMSVPINLPRRSFLGAAAIGAASQLAPSMPVFAQSAASSNPSGAANSRRASPQKRLEPLRNIDAGVLNVGYFEAGPANGAPVILLHGWPYDIHTYVDVAPMLAETGYRVIVPYLRGYGTTRFLSSDAVRNGQPAAIAVDMIALMDALKIEKTTVAGCDWGARTADIMAAIWPARVNALVSVSGYLIGSQEAGKMPLPPQAELQWWYQFYFATERGRAGYDQNRHDFAKLIWQTASPKWAFDDATFDRSALAFDNPDHVSIVIHNYRWRLGLAEGEAKYSDLETRLAKGPVIAVPTITLEGDANGAPHLEPSAYAKKFSGPYAHRLIKGGIGHNLPQEAPEAFASAVVDVARL